jgi:hypothetical protein
MTPEQQAFTAVLPTWTLVRQAGRTGAWYEKGALTIRLVELPSGIIASVTVEDKLLHRCPQGTETLEAALEDVKSYLDTAFPGMA